MNDERATRLPKWAQDEIKRLNDNVEYWKKKANAAMSPNANGTNTFVHDYLQNVRLGLPPDSRIGFRLSKNDVDDVECVVRDCGDEKRLHVMSLSGSQMLVRPSTSNVVEITCSRKF